MNIDKGTSYFSFSWTLLLVLPLLALVYGACSTTKKPQPEPAPEKTVPQKGMAVLRGYSDNGYLLVRYEGKNTPDRNVTVRPIGIYAPATAPLANPTLWDGIEDRPATRACMKEVIEKRRNSFLNMLQDSRVTVELPEEKKLRKDENRDFWRAHVYYENDAGKHVSLAEELIRRGLNTVNKYTSFQSIKNSLESLQEESKKANSGCWSCMDPPERFKEEEKEDTQLAEKRSREDEQAEKEETKQKEEVDSKQKQSETANKEEEKGKEEVKTKQSERKEATEKEISEEEKEGQSSNSGSSSLVKKSREDPSKEKEQKQTATRKSSKKVENKEVEKKESGKKEDKPSSTETSIYAKGPSMNNYPGSPKKVDIKKMMSDEESAHFKIDFGGQSSRQNCGWFMFRLDNAGGKKVRIDLTNIGRYDKWKTLNPVYAEIPNLSDPKYFVSKKPRNGYKYVEARNGPKVPKTKGLQHWHYITNVETIDASETLILRQKFSKDRVFIAMRTPYTTDLNEQYMKILKRKRGVKVHEVGESDEGNPLYVVQIGGVSREASRKRPCILLYSREHGDEHNSSWVAQGAIEFLLSRSEQARRLRSKVTLLVIPQLDPDSSVHSRYRGMLRTFFQGSHSRESLAYARFFKQWIDEGRRLDMVWNMHNVESREGPHTFIAEIDTRGQRGKWNKLFDKRLGERLKKNGYRVRIGGTDTGFKAARLGWYLSRYYAPMNLIYEVNSQAKKRHLSLRQLKNIGRLFVQTGVSFLRSEEAQPLLAEIQKVRSYRRMLRNRYEPIEKSHFNDLTPLDYEERLLDRPDRERLHASQLETFHEESWIYKLYHSSTASRNNIPPSRKRE